jgi:dipeptidase E
MKLLLTSAGVKNANIHAALLDLLGKPIANSSALCIPTALYGHQHGSPGGAWRFIAGTETPMCELGWKSVGVLELTALPSIDRERWVRWVREADACWSTAAMPCICVTGCDSQGLRTSWSQCTTRSGSAGSMVMTPRVGEHFVETKPPITGDDLGLGIVDFSIFPHLEHPAFPENTMATAERWAAGLGFPAYAIDDETAIKWSAAPSKSSLRATGSSSPASRDHARSQGGLRARPALSTEVPLALVSSR